LTPDASAIEMFSRLDTHQIELNSEVAKDVHKTIKEDTLKDIRKGDILFFHSTSDVSPWAALNVTMPTATKEGKTYKIHHVAFIEKINYSE
jgi:hypothetical protein